MFIPMFIPMFLVLVVVDTCIVMYILRILIDKIDQGVEGEVLLPEVFILSSAVLAVVLLGGDGSPMAKKLDIPILMFPIVFFLDYIIIKKIFSTTKR